MLYRVRQEKAVVNERKIVCPLENAILLVLVASNRSSLVEEFQMEYDQQYDQKNILSPPSNKPPCKIQKINKSQEG